VSLLDLIRSRDGSLSQTKLAASCFHLAMFVTVCWITYVKRDFVLDMWVLYAGVAVGHAVVDKAGAQIQDFKTKKLDKETQPGTLP
jgi:hypothetical protein